MRAVFRYPGSKWSIARWIISHFPAGYEKMVYAGLYDQNEVLYGSAEVVLADEIRSIPAADVAPVVRCGECKHNKGKKIWADGNETFDCTNGHGYPPLDWFCADGEKKEES